MRFAVIRRGNSRVPGLVTGTRLVPLAGIWAEVVGEKPLVWPDAFESLHEHAQALSVAAELVAETDGLSFDEGDLEPPAINPGKILCVGLNYTDHVEEVGLERPPRPHVFSKLRTALNSPRGHVFVPWDVTTEIDYEAELAIVIGKGGRNISAAEAMEFVLGYTVANDISARDWQFAPDGQLTLGKGFDGFLPLGPWVVSLDELADPHDLAIRCQVDDEIRQDASTAQMVAGPAEIIAFVSRVCTLEPGDIIATGTPAGVGFGQEPKQFLGKGQTVTTEIEEIGSLVNTIN